MIRLRNTMAFSFLLLVILLALSGCGGGGSSLTPEQRAVSDAFTATALDPAQIILASLNLGSGIESRLPAPAISSLTASSLALTKSLSNIVVDGTMATATATITITGQYSASGTFGSTPWINNESFTLTGSGTIHFRNDDSTWVISDIPGIALTSTNSPTISSVTRTSQFTVGESASVTFTATSANPSNSRIFAYGLSGFGMDVSSLPSIHTSYTSPTAYTFSIATVPSIPNGVYYGGIAVIELSSSDYTNTNTHIYFGAYLMTVPVSATE